MALIKVNVPLCKVLSNTDILLIDGRRYSDKNRFQGRPESTLHRKVRL